MRVGLDRYQKEKLPQHSVFFFFFFFFFLFCFFFFFFFVFFLQHDESLHAHRENDGGWSGE